MSTHADPDADPTPAALGRGRRWLVLAVLSLALFVIAIDASILNVALPTLSRDLAPTSTELLWIVDVYGFVLAGLLVTMGGLGDRIGRRRLLLIGAVVFGVASAGAALATSPAMLIAARSLLGVGGAMMMPATLSILRNVFTDSRERATAIGVWSAVSAGGFALGPVVGGALLAIADWQVLFAINVPIVLVAIVATLLVVPESRNPDPGPFDLVAAPLSISGMVALVWGIKEGAKQGFTETSVIAALAIGVLLLAVFVRRQWRSASPIVDVQLFRDRRFAGAALAVLLGFFALGALLLFITQFLQLVQGLTPLEAGLRMLPVALAAAAAAPLTAALVQRVGQAAVVGGGLALIAAMLGVLSGLRPDTATVEFLVPLVVTGAGFGLVSTAASAAIMTLAPAERAGGAAAVQETAYELGAALGVAVFGSVLAARYRTALELPDSVPEPVAEAVAEGLPAASVAAEQLGPPGAQVLLAAQDAFMAGFADTMVAAAVVMGAAAVIIASVLLGSGTRDRTGRPRRSAPTPSGDHAGTST